MTDLDDTPKAKIEKPTTYPLRVDVTPTDYFAFKALTNRHHGLQAQVLRAAVKWAIKEMKSQPYYRQMVIERLEKEAEDATNLQDTNA